MISFRSLSVVTASVVTALAWTGRPASAQTGTPAVSWNNGLTVSFDDGDNMFQLGALVQVDGRFTVDDPLDAVTDTFVLRRLRPILQGRAGKYFEFRLMPDLGNGTAVLFDAYFDMKFSKGFRIRIGKDKTPVGLEQLYSDYAVLFPERTLVTNLVPNRDVGIQAIGDLGGGVLSYDGALFNGVPDAANGDIDTNSRKDLAGRLVLRPFNSSRHGVLTGAGIWVGGSRGDEAGPLPSFKSSAQQTFFSYVSGATANGRRTRVSPAVFYYYRSVGAFAEYVRSTQAVKMNSATADVANRGWEVTGSFVLTGETATERGVTPKRPFDPAQGQWGAFQIIARRSRLTIDPVAFADSLAASTASRSATATGVCGVWYVNQYVKYVLSFERTLFDDDPHAKRQPEHALIFRLQFNLQPSL